jgi:hypothetical protein
LFQVTLLINWCRHMKHISAEGSAEAEVVKPVELVEGVAPPPVEELPDGASADGGPPAEGAMQEAMGSAGAEGFFACGLKT